MRRRLAGMVGAALLLGAAVSAGSSGNRLQAYASLPQRLLQAARGEGQGWKRLTELTDTFGHRLSGSPQLELALHWGAERMRADGLDEVRLEPVMVPHWVRGQESLELLSPVRQKLVLLGLGNSIGTPSEGLEAELAVVQSFEELDARGAELKGKIVLYDVPFTNYRETARYRGSGASRAARHGAVAVLLRSVGPVGLRSPHTGAMRYDPEQPQIPAAAIPAEDAARLHRLIDGGLRPRVRLEMEARMLPDVPSANLVAEIRGREKPNEVVLLGAHIDSWDVGTGAMDDGAGCAMVWEALRLIRAAGLKPRRTIRLVWFTNEENGLRGGQAYRDRYQEQLKDHVLAFETDSGAFKPKGFGFSGDDKARAQIREIAALLAPIGATEVGAEGGGADIGPSVEAGKLPSASLSVEGERYFVYHHSPADTLERLDPDDVATGSASIALLAYVVADQAERLGQ